MPNSITPTLERLTSKQYRNTTNQNNSTKGINMLYVIRRDWQEWVEAFSTLAEAQTRFAALKAECPDWNLQILAEEQEIEDKPEQGKIYSLTGAKGEACIAAGNTWAESEVKVRLGYEPN
jgi:hypothetical protein